MFSSKIRSDLTYAHTGRPNALPPLPFSHHRHQGSTGQQESFGDDVDSESRRLKRNAHLPVHALIAEAATKLTA